MSDLTIRPTAKFIRAGTIFAAAVFLGLEIAYLALWRAEAGAWFMVLPLLVFAWPGLRALRRALTKAVISTERLRYETGFTSKSTRTIQLAKVQDVRVDQRLVQRLWNVGDISIETAGEASRLTIADVDDPQSVADEIMNRAQKGAAAAG